MLKDWLSGILALLLILIGVLFLFMSAIGVLFLLLGLFYLGVALLILKALNDNKRDKVLVTLGIGLVILFFVLFFWWLTSAVYF